MNGIDKISLKQKLLSSLSVAVIKYVLFLLHFATYKQITLKNQFIKVDPFKIQLVGIFPSN